ncbi:MAG: dipeptide ABC transporter ATP-binding protein [Alphaproteobacteria bacterium]|jgi:peptide/nickel transport system ATP-binding protein|nr:dipeptide ABC transporter ATP-binding protein [Alphaproteobacteria bacterium]
MAVQEALAADPRTVAPDNAVAAEAASPVLEIDNLNISYFTRAGEIPAVIDFSLTVKPGEAVGLVGESGCGKTTVAMAIMQYLGGNGRIVGGSIRFKGRDMNAMSEEELRQLRGSQIAMVYQEPMAALNPSMTIGSQLMEVPLYHEPNCSQEEAFRRAVEMLGNVRLADAARVMSAYPHQISGGQQQRVVIAMALLSNPALLLLDEPTTALDVTVEAGIVELIAEISRSFGTSMLYISHNLGLIRETCDRVCVMYSGEVAEEGTIRELFENPRHPYTRGLFGCIATPGKDKYAKPLTPIRGQLPLPHERPPGCNFGPRCDHFRDGRCDAGMIRMQSVDPATAHRARCIRWQEIDWDNYRVEQAAYTPIEPGETVLESREMQKYYPIVDRSLAAMLSGRAVRYVKANESLTFQARKRQTVAIVGESGCGKSTFAKVLMGLETATGGELVFNGKDVAEQSVMKRTPAQIASLQMVFQNPNDTLNPSMTVGSQIGRVLRKFRIARDPQEIEQRVLDLLDVVKLPRAFINRRPRQLSGGQKQRVGIARAFAGNPAMVIADEPVSALDVSVQAAVTGLLMDIQREYDTTLLFISHDLGVVRYLADRVVVMYLGQIMEQGDTEAVFAPPYHPYTEALLSAVPIADTRVRKRRIILEGALPSVLDPPKGCPFHTRCPRKIGAICEDTPPPEQEAESGHSIRCHIPMDELRRVEPVIQYNAE